MQPFTKLTGITAPLPMANVDTDKIIPARFLKTIGRTGLGSGLFSELRYFDDGSERPDFVLNHEPYRRAQILIAGVNFGCGSSREHAPWALLDFGIRCVIAPGYADIFYNNCFKNGMLPAVLPQDQVDELLRQAETLDDPVFTVDLEAQEIYREGANRRHRFEIDPFRKHCLLNGLDDIGLTLQRGDRIAAYEERQRFEQPWLQRRGTAA